MNDLDLNELEVTPAEVVAQMVEEFAAALAETPEFQAWERTSEALQHDAEAQGLAEAFNAKVSSLRMQLMLKAVSPEHEAELHRLQRAFNSRPSVVAQVQAQEALSVVCQAAAGVLSEAVGLDWSTACQQGCCG